MPLAHGRVTRSNHLGGGLAERRFVQNPCSQVYQDGIHPVREVYEHGGVGVQNALYLCQKPLLESLGRNVATS